MELVPYNGYSYYSQRNEPPQHWYRQEVDYQPALGTATIYDVQIAVLN